LQTLSVEKSLSDSTCQRHIIVLFPDTMVSDDVLRCLAAIGLLALPLSVVAGPTESPGVVANRDTTLAWRALQKPFSGGQLSCAEKDDPSYASGKSRFKDGQGKYVGSGCDANKGSSRQCWYVFQVARLIARQHFSIAIASSVPSSAPGTPLSRKSFFNSERVTDKGILVYQDGLLPSRHHGALR
jgi:hypothetical protein